MAFGARYSDKPLLRVGCVAGAICYLGSLAWAQPADDIAWELRGFYVGAGAGVSVPLDADAEGPGINTDIEWDSGLVAIAAAGYNFGQAALPGFGLRTELELGWRDHDADAVGSVSSGGAVTAISMMANAVIDLIPNSRIVPYAGLGVGGAHLDIDNLGIGGTTMRDEATTVAYQGLLGASYALTPALLLSLDYRYFRTHGAEFDTAAGLDIETDFASHNLLLGIRYQFGAPVTPAEPVSGVASTAPRPEPKPETATESAPAPEPTPEPESLQDIQRSYLVFFDWDSATVTAEAEQVVVSAATTAYAYSVTEILLAGHTDSSGAKRYNENLSRRRADAVATILMREGVPATSIMLVARGEEEPLVQTANDVREPQNRRVEIILED